MSRTSTSSINLLFGMRALVFTGVAIALGSQALADDVPPIAPGSWTLAILPDTQMYSQEYPDTFDAQTQWIVDHKVSQNIQFVFHEGDIVNNNSVQQWNNAKTSLDILSDNNVPFALSPGNHDYGPGGNATSRSSLFNDPSYFGPGSPYATQPTMGGFFEAGKTDNSYQTFSAGGEDWMVISLEFGPRDEVVDWAKTVVEANPTRKAILVTHAYLYNDDTRYDFEEKGFSQTWSPYSYGVANLPGGVNDGEQLWDKLVSKYDNFEFALNGHVLGDGTGYLGSVGDNGNVVHQMLANYQTPINEGGGNGYMRLLEFNADGETVEVRTYSPVLEEFDNSFDQRFTLNRNEVHPPLVGPSPPVILHAVGGNLVVTGPTDPQDNTVGGVSIPQSALPGMSTQLINEGDYQIAVDGEGLKYQDGILLASVTQNVRNGIRATVEVGRNSFGDGILTLSVTEAGNGSENEVNVNTSAAWFMFGAGWQGAHVDADGTIASAGGVDQSMVTKTGTGRYEVDLGVGATASDGMLFAIANNNTNKIVQTRVLPDGTWDMRVQDNASNFSATGLDAAFSVLYLPYDTNGLIGGLYSGFSESHVNSAGVFTMDRLDTGQYELAIPGETPDTGMLILTIARESTSGATSAPDDNFLTYEASGTGTFLINSYDLAGVDFQDTDFVWAFIDFSDPISMPAAVPEPATSLLLLIGPVFCLLLPWKRRVRATSRVSSS